MNKIAKALKNTSLLTFLLSNLLATVNATSVTGEHTLNFDHTIDNPLSFVNSAGNVFTPFIITGGSVVPDIGENLLQDGIRTGIIGIGSTEPFDNLGTGHLHYKTGFGGTIGVAFEADSGGAWIDADGSSFAFKSMYFGAMSHDVNAAGYLPGGGKFSAVLSTTAANSTVQFQDLDSRFGNVTLVEMWINEVGRGTTGPVGGSITYDNVVLTSPVPIPAAFYLFMSGLIGLLGISKREKHSK